MKNNCMCNNCNEPMKCCDTYIDCKQCRIYLSFIKKNPYRLDVFFQHLHFVSLSSYSYYKSDESPQTIIVDYPISPAIIDNIFHSKELIRKINTIILLK